MTEILSQRRESNRERLASLEERLVAAKQLAGSNACVYVTGSFARGEASEYSDLDLFIVGKVIDGKDNRKKRALSCLDEICIKASLIESMRAEKFPDLDGDGKYLVHHTSNDLVGTLGRPEDDSNNTFTARLLLLLESQPLLCRDVYDEIIGDVIAAYWRDYEAHSSEFMPAFLANDILRLWRTFCVNYEARTKSEPESEKAKRKLKNYKLKHSRLLTCYSALLFLLSTHKRRGTVHPNDVREMVKLSPTERIEKVAHDGEQEIKDSGAAVTQLYSKFLESTNRSEEELITWVLEPRNARSLQESANDLGDKVFGLLSAVGSGSRFFRLLMV